jgi:hypothetical protein
MEGGNIMSDAIWDIEYDKAYELEREIVEYCKINDINCPTFKQYIRSWELEEIFKEIKK